MDGHRATLDIQVLIQHETACRERLRTAPDDTETRSRLAWCLFVRAIHRAGEECLLSTSFCPPGIGVPHRSEAQRDAYQILKDCLRHAEAVSQLSGRDEHRSDVARLRQLARLSGGTEAVAEAQKEAARVIEEITRDMRRAAEQSSGKVVNRPAPRRLSRGRRPVRRFEG